MVSTPPKKKKKNPQFTNILKKTKFSEQVIIIINRCKIYFIFFFP